MRLIKFVFKIFEYLIRYTFLGFYFICLMFSRGFFFYFCSFFSALKLLFKRSKFCDSLFEYFKKRQESPASFLFVVLVFTIFVSGYFFIYGDTNEVVKLEETTVEPFYFPVEKEEMVSDDNSVVEQVKEVLEFNLFKKYGGMSLDSLDFNLLYQTNQDTILWISVDGTNINYPVVHTDNNEYYLSHNIKRKKDISGWIFMDYRNERNLSDNNTIIYGHNLLNKTSFGSVSNVFTSDWFNSSNHLIKIISDSFENTYEIFSVYYSEPDNYYLQTNFSTDDSYYLFLNNLKSKSVVDFSTDVATTDRIVTLSTCTHDNKGRMVIHAKMISSVGI